MKGEKVTIINGEVCRGTNNTGRSNQNDASLLLPLNNSSGQVQERSFLSREFFGISILFFALVMSFLSVGILLLFFKSALLTYLFHFLTFITSLFMSEYFRTYVAYRLITDNIEEKNRLKSFLSLNPMLLLSSIDYISLTMMLATFVLLGMPMLSVNQTVKYEKLNPNWKRSIVALSGPFSFLLFGGLFGIIYNVEVLCSNLHHFEGSISQALYLGARLLAFLTIINVLPFPPITDGFMATSPYLPDWVNLEISNARNTILFFILCTLLFIFIAQSKLVADIVDIVVSNLYMIKI